MRAPLILLAVFIILVILAPLIAPSDPTHTDPVNQLQPPSAEHLLGTDLLGRDVLSRALYGGQHTLLIAGLATLIAVVPGVALGLLSAVADKLTSLLINAVLAFPGLLLALVILTVLGQGALPLALATGLIQIAPCARVTRAAVISVSVTGYVEAARGLGASELRVILRHILPNVLSTLLAYTAVIFAYAILNSAALSFLGLGGEPGIPDWGVMLYEGRQAFRLAPWIGAAPGVAITLTVILLNRAADAIHHP
ncbi:MAG TPA: ABC transporter permease [Phototrophicaceae bacterium]|nr:ABC transporter permease [Phototrophicaceae bacterium]